jgi:hypothetical protein
MERRIQLIVYRHEAAATVPSGLPAAVPGPPRATAARGSYFARVRMVMLPFGPRPMTGDR